MLLMANLSNPPACKGPGQNAVGCRSVMHGGPLVPCHISRLQAWCKVCTQAVQADGRETLEVHSLLLIGGPPFCECMTAALPTPAKESVRFCPLL